MEEMSRGKEGKGKGKEKKRNEMKRVPWDEQATSYLWSCQGRNDGLGRKVRTMLTVRTGHFHTRDYLPSFLMLLKYFDKRVPGLSQVRNGQY